MRVYLIDNFKSLETEKLLFSFNIPPSHSAYSYSAKNLVQLHESQGEAQLKICGSHMAIGNASTQLTKHKNFSKY